MKNKTVLFVTYYFPPAGGPSVQRALKFIKYLPTYGWNPIVFTAKECIYPILDTSLSADIPTGTKIYRGKSWDINAWQPQFRKYKLARLHALLNTMLSLPDSAYLWTKLNKPLIDEIITAGKPDVVFSTSGPYSAHLLAMGIKAKYKLPWVADFRDPWSQNRIIRYPPGYRWANRKMEVKVLKRADRVITVSEPIARNLFTLVSPKTNNICVIPNGFDSEDISSYDYEPTKKLTITYTGKFTRTRDPKAFIDAILFLIENGDIPANEIEAIFAGSNLDPYIPDRPPFIKLGYISHTEVAHLLKRSNILLLVQDPSPESMGDYSAKVFEYLASNRPILAITSQETVAAKLIKQSNSGTVVEHNFQQIAECIQKYYLEWKQGGIFHQPDWQLINSFNRKQLTKQLSDIFNNLA